MNWAEDGIVLSARKHGESAAVVQLLTRDHGRHAGLVRGGAGRRARGVLQPGNRVAARWQARLAAHLGTYVCELTRSHAAELLDDPLRLAGLSAACAMAEASLPEREPHGAVYEGFLALLQAMATPDWPRIYVRWELGLLAELGYGLDLSSCAATGANDELAYVSPKSGRAVSLSAGEPYREKLLPLPRFLAVPRAPAAGDLAAGDLAAGDVAKGLRLTGYFLERHVFAPLGRGLPAARRRLAERLEGA